jgi:hypothetical protein
LTWGVIKGTAIPPDDEQRRMMRQKAVAAMAATRIGQATPRSIPGAGSGNGDVSQGPVDVAGKFGGPNMIGGYADATAVLSWDELSRQSLAAGVPDASDVAIGRPGDDCRILAKTVAWQYLTCNLCPGQELPSPGPRRAIQRSLRVPGHDRQAHPVHGGLRDRPARGWWVGTRWPVTGREIRLRPRPPHRRLH